MVKSKNYKGDNILCEYHSTNVKSSDYNTVTKALIITFGNGLQYEYDDVPHEIFSAMNLSESQGKYFNKNIAKSYNYKKL